MTEKRRFPEIDAMYFLGTLLVVLGHSHSSDWSTFSGTFLEDLIVFIYRFHMPAFFFVAGFLFLNSRGFERLGLKKWIAEKAGKLLIPYVTLSLIVIIPKYMVEHHGIDGFGQYLVEAIFIPRVGVWGHFWFLPVLLMCYILFGIWRTYFLQKKIRDSVALVLVTTVIYFLPIKIRWFALSDLKDEMIFFAAGILAYSMGRRKFHKRESVVRITEMVLTFGVSLVLHTKFSQYKMLLLIVAFLMIDCMWQMSCLLESGALISWVSRHNFTIYIYSWPAQAVAMVLCTALGFPWYLTTPVMFAVGLAVPSILAVAYEKINCIHNRFFDLVLGIK